MSDHVTAPDASVPPADASAPVGPSALAGAPTSDLAPAGAPASVEGPASVDPAAGVPAPLPAGLPVPVPAHEPPYYAAIFTSLRTDGDNGYGETAARMDELVREIPGFLGEDSAATPGGLRITVAYFRDETALAEWRAHAEHRAAQRRGRAEWYEQYVLHVAKVERSHGFVRAGE
ncbi:antibiotic biosynthesis monooxygenase [Streptomyces sp. NPDC002004]